MSSTLAAALTLLAFAGAAQAQTASVKPAAPAPAAAVDPEAVAALERMGGYLRSLKIFQVESATTDEDVLDDGQKVQYAGVTNFIVKIPSGLRVEESNDRHERIYFFDGKSFTLYAKRINYYATVPAPATLGELVTSLADNYDLSIPLVDLFYWGSPGWTPTNLTAATDIGPAVVAGTTCEQYAFRQEGLDWQLWIQKGDFALPRRLVITTLTDEARPQHSATFTWNLAPSINDAAFTFDAPDDAQRVLLGGGEPTDGSGN